MRIAVSSVGSEGDVRPYVALAQGLRAAGHDAWLIAASPFEQRAVDAGVPFRPSGQPFDPDAYRRAMVGVLAERNPLRQARRLIDMTTSDFVAAVPGVLEATRDAELIIHHQIDVAAFAAALVHRRRRVTGAMFPTLLPGGLEATIGRLVAPWLADASHNRILAAAGLPKRTRILLEVSESPLLNLLAVSPTLIAPRPAWEKRWVMTGYWFLEEQSFAPDATLRAFVEAGDPPIIVTFGSMAGTDAARVTAIIRDAAQRARRRVVVQAGMSQLGGGEVSGGMCSVDYVPHDWLLPRAAGIVHHGGAGTCAAAIRAGIPQAVVWHMGDQPMWGKLLYKRGVAVAPLRQTRVSPRALASCFEQLATDAGMRDRAAALGAQVRAENGVQRAVEAITAVLHRRVASRNSAA